MGRPAIDYSGQTIGGYTVIRQSSYSDASGLAFWDVRCKCGFATTIAGALLKRNKVGCVTCRHEARVTHGHARRGKREPEYDVFLQMHQRCDNPNNKDYADYGGRGLTVCKRWCYTDGYINFMADMGPRPSPLHELDRRENSKGYSPGNCRWVTSKTNNRNRRSNVLVTYKGKTQTLAAWAEELGVPYPLVRHRIAIGWTPRKAFTTPANATRRNIDE
jgi:hypothetical protein